MAIKVDYYEGTAPFGAVILDAANDWGGQYWTTSEAYTIESVEFWCAKGVGDNVGTIEVELYAADGAHKPTGAILASGTIDDGDIGDTTAYSWVSCTFTVPYALSNATEYCLAIHGDSLSASDILYGASDDTGYADAARLFSADGGSSWTVVTANDTLFRTYKAGGTVYGEGTKTVTGAGTVSLASEIVAWGEGILIITASGTVILETESYIDTIGWPNQRASDYDPDLYWDEATETWGSTRVTIPGAFAEYLVAVGEEGEVYFGTV